MSPSTTALLEWPDAFGARGLHDGESPGAHRWLAGAVPLGTPSASSIKEALAEIETLLRTTDPGKRGVTRVQVPGDLLLAAKQLLRHERSLILTGFPIVTDGKPSEVRGENDGPPGAIALAEALALLGRYPVIVGCDYVAPHIRKVLEGSDYPETKGLEVVTFGLREAPEKVSQRILEIYDPDTIVAIERPGPGRDGKHRTMRGRDITRHVARMDDLVEKLRREKGTIISALDGGNELGAGHRALQSTLPRAMSNPGILSAVPADLAITAGTSNWGAYAIVAALSLLTDRNLLPKPERERSILEKLKKQDLVDGVTGEPSDTVDGIGADTLEKFLRDLNEIVLRGLSKKVPA